MREAMARAAAEIAADPGTRYAHPKDLGARRMKARGGGRPFGYNAQAAVDAKEQIIVAADASNESTDQRQLVPMLDAARENLGPHRDGEGEGTTTLADAGYPSAEQIGRAERGGHDVLMPMAPKTEPGGEGADYHCTKFAYDAARDVVTCPEGRELTFRRERRRGGNLLRVYRGEAAACRACPAFGICTRDRHGRSIDISGWHGAVERHREKMRAEPNLELLKERGRIVEPVFGQIKSNGGFWRWTFSGVEKVATQWSMLCTAWNLKVMYRAWKTRLAGAAA